MWWMPAALADEGMLVGHEVRSYEAAMKLPTAVAAGPAGEVWVADGVNNRVVEFGADGQLRRSIHEVAGKALSNPTVVAADDNGWLWIGDAGNRRVTVVPKVPGVEFDLVVDAKLRTDLEITGLAVSGDGQSVWVVDNRHHRVLRGSAAGGPWTVSGSYGEALGQLRYPFMAATHQGDVWVTDVLNARVAGFSATEALRPIGRFGVAPGQLFRPKGIAFDATRAWVSDSSLGVIQAFSPAGRLLDVLRDAQGRILELQAPVGLASRGDRLFVVEMAASRVRELRIAAEFGRPYRAQASSGSQRQECSMCHLEMVPALSRGGGGLLTTMPANPEDDPYVASEASCMSCHDGSVLDSRRAVWALHGHPLDEPVPATMKVPTELPLVGGKMACRTCHSAHTVGGSGQMHRKALMLRVTDDPDELCVACHGSMGGAP